jgi:hypothetical protein
MVGNDVIKVLAGLLDVLYSAPASAPSKSPAIETRRVILHAWVANKFARFLKGMPVPIWLDDKCLANNVFQGGCRIGAAFRSCNRQS